MPRTVGGVWCSVASPPRPTVEFVLVRALAHERRRAGEGPSFGGRDEGHHDVGPPSSSSSAAAAAAAAASTSRGRGRGVLGHAVDVILITKSNNKPTNNNGHHIGQVRNTRADALRAAYDKPQGVIDGARERAFVHSRRTFEPKHFILECRQGPAEWNRCTTKTNLVNMP